jgi:hypothetical protein
MAKIDQRFSREDLRFWFLWVAATMVGLTVGMLIRQLLFRLGAWATNPMLVGAVVGMSLGIAQLKKFNWKWILGTATGWAVGWSVGWNVGWNLLGGLGLIAVFTLIGAIAGALSGALQWLSLRQVSSRAGWWVPASAIAWTLGMAIGTSLGGPLGWPLVGATSGAITGLVLLWIV